MSSKQKPKGMKPGTVKVGDCVRTIVSFDSYPSVKPGHLCTVREIIAQYNGAQADAVLIHPHALGWHDNETFPCTTDDITLTWP